MIELPKAFSTAVEAYNAADRLRECGDSRPMEVIVASNGQAFLRLAGKGERNDNSRDHQ